MQVIIIGQDRGQNYLDLVEFCSVRGIKLAEEKITSTNKPSVQICPECGHGIIAFKEYRCANGKCDYSGKGKSTHVA